MKKSLVIISFAFIFLLTLSVVSAGLWITGDVKGIDRSDSDLRTSISKTSDIGTTNTFSRSAGVSATSQKRSQAPEFQCPRGGWKKVAAKESGFCCVKTEGKKFLGLVIAE